MWRISISLCLLLVAGIAGAQQQQYDRLPQYIPSRVVWSSPDQSTVVIRVGEYDNARDITFELGASTKFWGQSPYLVQTGLYVARHHEGSTAFWYHRGVGGRTSVITQLQFVPPEVNE